MVFSPAATVRATSPSTGYGEVRFSTNGHRAAYFQISLVRLAAT